MLNPLERKSLPVRLADIIEDECKTGEWGAALPGHRTLVDRYSVSAKTCLAALALLEARGLITPAEQGKKRRILAQAGKVAKSLQNLLIIDGYGSPSGEDLLQLHAYRTAWEEAGGSVQLTNLDFPRYRRPSALLERTVSNHRADALLLHVPPLAWVEAAARLRPVFLSGGEWRGEKITGVGFHIKDEITRLAARLRLLGHERVVVPLDLVGRRMEDAVREGLADGLGIRHGLPLLSDYCPVFSERVPAAWQSYWKKLFAGVRPTAIILLDDIRVVSLYGYCSQHGISIPGDVSVVCLESTEHLEWTSPVPTRMRFPIHSATGYFKKWLRGGCRPIGMKFFALDFIEADSVAAPHRRR